MVSKSGTLRIAIVGDTSRLPRTMDDATGILSSWAGGAAAIVGGIGLAGGALLVSEFGDAIERAQMGDKLAAQLGATPEEAARYGQIAGDLWADAYGESLADAHEAVDAVVSTLGRDLDDGALEALTAKAMDFAAAFDQDVTTSVNAVGVLMRTGLARDADQAFDLMVAASQQVPREMRGELIPIVEEYAQDFVALGITGEEAFGLLVDGASRGRFELDKTGDALKELTIRTSDMSTASTAAFESLGLDAEEMAERFITGGDTARGALDDIVDALLAVEDPVERANTAIALFGTPLEDLSTSEIPDFLTALQEMGGGFGEVEGAADRMGEALNENTSFESFKRRAGAALESFLSENVVPVANDILAAFDENGVGGAVDAAIDAWEDAQPRVQAWWDGTFTPWWDAVAVPWMGYMGGELGVALVNGLLEALVATVPAMQQQLLGLIADVMPAGLAGLVGRAIEDFDIPDVDVPNFENPVDRPDNFRLPVPSGPSQTLQPFNVGGLVAFHEGGRVRVAGGGEGIARVMHGESVLTADQTRVLARFVDQVDSGKLAGRPPIVLQVGRMDRDTLGQTRTMLSQLVA